MATGSGPLHQVRLIVDTAVALEPRSVLDLGMGTGKYGFLLREQHDFGQIHHGRNPWRLRLVGVEGYADYVGDLQPRIYDEVIVADALEFLVACEDRFDIALALDILEHFEPQRGKELVDHALRVARFLIVATPRGFYRQEGHANMLERHLSWWPAKALRRLARDVEAQIAVTRDRYATVAVLSRAAEPRLADEKWPELRTVVRSALVPEIAWCRLRGKAGPTIAF